MIINYNFKFNQYLNINIEVSRRLIIFASFSSTNNLKLNKNDDVYSKNIYDKRFDLFNKA